MSEYGLLRALRYKVGLRLLWPLIRRHMRVYAAAFDESMHGPDHVIPYIEDPDEYHEYWKAVATRNARLARLTAAQRGLRELLHAYSIRGRSLDRARRWTEPSSFDQPLYGARFERPDMSAYALPVRQLDADQSGRTPPP